MVNDNVLYKKTSYGISLRCMDAAEMQTLVEKFMLETLALKMNGDLLPKKIQCQGY